MKTLEEIKNRQLRLYSFVNYYLSDLQRGLQTAHLVSEIFTKYILSNDNIATILNKWACKDKTIIILNGGNCEDLMHKYNILNKISEYPFAMFCEDKNSLNGALTCIGIIFPEFYKEDLEFYSDVPDGDDIFIDIMRLIYSCKLA
jgi:hypothetical protein